jgi:response regulator of citrate/malate metabolism
MPDTPRRYSEAAMQTWFYKELRKRYPPSAGSFTAGQAANSVSVSRPTAQKYLRRLVGQGELTTLSHVLANGVVVTKYAWKGQYETP